MSEYKKILSGYVNTSKDGSSEYLKLTNITDEVITITLQPNSNKGDSYFINKTKDDVKQRYPSVPDFSKSVKVEEEQPVVVGAEDINSEDIPF